MCTRTLSNKSKKQKEPVVPSPYFSPTRERVATATSFHLENPVSKYTPRTKTPTVSDTEDKDDTAISDDPLFRYYFRSFARLYYQLSYLKPLLIQEKVASNPWKLLIAVTLLNKTAAKLAIPVFWEILAKWPTPWTLSQANETELATILYHLGTQNIRANRLVHLSRAYLQDPPSISDLRPSRPTMQSAFHLPSPHKRERYPATVISHLPGTGPYALDSYRIFCTSHENPSSEEWKAVTPTDKELIKYLKWKWAFTERIEWAPKTGVIRSASLAYLRILVSELAGERLSNETPSIFTKRADIQSKQIWDFHCEKQNRQKFGVFTL